MSILDKKYAIELDAATIDALYTAIAGPPNENLIRRWGHGGASRAFNEFHKIVAPMHLPWPADLRQAVRDEGKWAVVDEPDLTQFDFVEGRRTNPPSPPDSTE